MADPSIKAFTLIEALIGASVITIALVGMYSTWIFISTNMDRARVGSEAGEIARAEMERFKAYGVPSGYTDYPVGACNPATGITYGWVGAYDPNDTNTATDQNWHSGHTSYFDVNGNSLSSSTGARFSLSDTVTDTNIDLNSCSATVPYSFSTTSRRQVLVTVTDLTTGVAMSFGTFLVQGGV